MAARKIHKKMREQIDTFPTSEERVNWLLYMQTLVSIVEELDKGLDCNMSRVWDLMVVHNFNVKKAKKK